jgi:hypothetical protein
MNSLGIDLSGLSGIFAITDRQVIYYFFKAFSVVFALIFVLFVVILRRQSIELTETVSTESNAVIRLFSMLQLILSILLFLFAVFLL